MNRHDTIQAAQTRDCLARHPGMHPDAIASHYLALAATAATIKELVNAHRYANKSDASLEALMERATQQIRSAHLRDFGIALEWRTNESVEEELLKSSVTNLIACHIALGERADSRREATSGL